MQGNGPKSPKMVPKMAKNIAKWAPRVWFGAVSTRHL